MDAVLTLRAATPADRPAVEAICVATGHDGHDARGVHLGVSPTNPQAIGFSEHRGFEPHSVEADGGLIMARRV